MRELVYLSQAKLDQFVGNETGWLKTLGFNLEASVPSVGKIGVERPSTAGDPIVVTRRLRKVIAGLKRSTRMAASYDQPDAPPGQWVYFEARMNCCVLTRPPFEGSVIFLDGNGQRHAGAHETRLLLHGSSNHLRLNRTSIHNGDLPQQVAGRYPSFAGWIDEIARHTLLGQPPEPVVSAEGARNPATSHSMYVYAQGMQALVAILDNELSFATAAPMAGLARITAAAPPEHWIEADRQLGSYWSNPLRVVAASPLYVEFASPEA